MSICWLSFSFSYFSFFSVCDRLSLDQIKGIFPVFVLLGEFANVVAQFGHLGVLPDLIYLGEAANVVAHLSHLFKTWGSDEAAEHNRGERKELHLY